MPAIITSRPANLKEIKTGLKGMVFVIVERRWTGFVWQEYDYGSN